MAVSTKIIKRRIKSIGSTKKITKAMEMISAVKMRRAVNNVLATRSYANLAWEMLNDVAKTTDISVHPLLARRKVKKIGLILITSNRGLAGGFNSRLLTEVDRFVKTASDTSPNPSSVEERKPFAPSPSQRRGDGERFREVEILLSGRRGKKIHQRFGHTVIAEFEKIDLTTKIEEILPLARLAVGEYTKGAYDSIVIAYTDFVSALKQVPRVKQLLPLQAPDSLLGYTKTEAAEGGRGPSPSQRRGQGEVSLDEGEFLFEPNPKAVLDILLPRLVEMQIYQAVLESDASEHSARMMAMRSASDAAEDIIKELQYNFNKARQAAITQEIAEIVGGVAAFR